VIRKNPPSFVLIDKAMGTVVYTKRATGVGSEAISACVKKGRELAQKNNRVYTVFLDIMGLKIGSRVNVGQIYHLGITEEIGPTGSAMPSGRRCCSSPDVCPSGQGMRCFNCQHWEADNYLKNPRGAVRKNIFAFNNPGNAQKILAENFVKGANSGVASSMYIHGNRIYSYGPHFPIAQRNNDGTILIRHPSKKAPSKTTAGHISAVVNAARQVFAPDSIIYDTAGELAAEAKGPAAYTNPTRGARLIKNFRCRCGRTVATEDADSDGTVQCDCGQLYNSFGQRLKDPSQWSGARDYEDMLDNPRRVRKNIFAFNNPRPLRRGESQKQCEYCGDTTHVRLVDFEPPDPPALMCEECREQYEDRRDARKNPRQRPQNEMERGAALVGLLVTTWAPGDGLTRYRFFAADGKSRYADYNQGGALYTANGRKEAISFIKSYGIGRSRMNPLTQAEHDRIREKDHHLIGRSQDASIKGKAYDAAYFSGAAHQSRNIREGYRGVGVQYIPNPCSNPTCTNPRHKHVRKNPLLQTILLANPQRRVKVGDLVVVSEGSGISSGAIARVVKPFDWKLEEGAYKPVPRGYVYLSLFRPGRSSGDKPGTLFTMPSNRLRLLGADKNPPISAQWDKMTTRQRIAVMNAAGYEGGYAVNRTWKQLDQSIRHNIESIWLDTSSRGGTTKRRRAVSVGANPLTRKESAKILREARYETGVASSFRGGHTRSSYSASAIGKASVVQGFGPKSARQAAIRVGNRAARIGSTTSSVQNNPGLSGIRFPKSGTKLTVEQALALASKIGDRELMRQCKEAAKLQTKANRGTKCVVWKTLPIGAPNKIEMVTAFAHYGDSPETMYKAPKGSKKGPHMYRHKWSEGKRNKRPVPILAAPGGKAMIQVMGPGQTIGDWMRG
jgi:hypothetical protein